MSFFQRRFRLSLVRFLTASFSLLSIVTFVTAHPPEEHQTAHVHADRTLAKSTSSNPASITPPANAIRLPKIEGAKPWSDAPHLNDPSRFQIAIMTDRTGGHRPGVWMHGVRTVNLLRPEFVVSVGDLIEGYTENEQEVEKEWKQFLSFIDKMEMKFFFVAGNHDITNPKMHKIWRKHFGKEWYSFDYKDVHFVCLSSENPVSSLGKKQLAWLEKDLEKNKNARWTLVFLHKPLWAYSERQIAAGNADTTGWPVVAKLLGSRPHSVFAGHTHNYLQFDRNGRKYYQLATTGGGSQLRGKNYGEFDQIMWLTMEKDGPHVANIKLDGVLPGSVVTEESSARFRRFLSKVAIEVAPIWVEQTDAFSKGRIDLRVTNHFDTTINLSGIIEGLPLRGLSLDPSAIRMQIKSGETKTLALALDFSKPIELTSLANTMMTAKIKTVGGKKRPLSAEWLVPVTIDRKYSFQHVAQSDKPKTIDGLLDDWDKLRFQTTKNARVLGAAKEWKGIGDASFRFDTGLSEKYIYFAAEVTDDTLVEGDAVEILIDARPLAQRTRDHRLGSSAYSLKISAPTNNAAGGVAKKISVQPIRSGPIQLPISAVAKKTKRGYNVELAIPEALLQKAQGKDWSSIQITVLQRDVDEAGQPAAHVLWRGDQSIRRTNRSYGQFVRAKSGPKTKAE